jgi:hypothetical protein
MSLSITTAFLLLALFILTAVLFFTSNYGSDTITYAQFQNNMSSSPLLGVNITSPQKGQQITANIDDLTISGKSTDKPTAVDDCQVSVIVNSVKPYQHARANGTTGESNDYSRWFFILNSNYTSIKEGVNKITAKLSCLPNVMGNNNMTKWYSVNVTGITTTNDTTPVPAQSAPVVNSSVQGESNNKDEPRPLESKANEEQEASIFGSNNNEKKIKEEIENLRERIMDRVEKSLEERGIELNLP